MNFLQKSINLKICSKDNQVEKYKDSNILKIKKYILDVLNHQLDKQYLKLPSIHALCNVFSVAETDIKGCLSELKSMGFQYLVLDKREPILIWDCMVQK